MPHVSLKKSSTREKGGEGGMLRAPHHRCLNATLTSEVRLCMSRNAVHVCPAAAPLLRELAVNAVRQDPSRSFRTANDMLT